MPQRNRHFLLTGRESFPEIMHPARFHLAKVSFVTRSLQINSEQRGTEINPGFLKFPVDNERDFRSKESGRPVIFHRISQNIVLFGLRQLFQSPQAGIEAHLPDMTLKFFSGPGFGQPDSIFEYRNPEFEYALKPNPQRPVGQGVFDPEKESKLLLPA